MTAIQPHPDPKVNTVEGIKVVRDDLITGGTKARVLPTYLEIIEAGQTVVYASPAYGYAQIALAHAAAATGRRAVIYVAKRNKPHPRTVEAYKAGATIIQVPNGYLSNVKSKARTFCETSGASEIPFGFDTQRFRELMTAEAKKVDCEPDHVWTVAGSGTLSRSLQKRWPNAQFHAVAVGRALKPGDVGNASIVKAPEKFEQNAQNPPPFPSCSNYDAKAWAHIKAANLTGVQLFWNVAA